jgi:hypothetical protein
VVMHRNAERVRHRDDLLRHLDVGAHAPSCKIIFCIGSVGGVLRG